MISIFRIPTEGTWLAREIQAVKQYNPPKKWFYNEEFGDTKETKNKSKEETAYMAVEIDTTMATMVDLQNPMNGFNWCKAL